MNKTAFEVVPVALGDRSYQVLIGDGLVEGAGALIGARFPGRKVAVVTDANLAGTHLHTLRAGLAAAGLQVRGELIVPAGEPAKCWSELERLCDGLLSLGLERRDLVIALGGGVTGDLVGCAAAVLRRGIDFVQMPTTLLAQVDSSVGGKTGINTRHGKNLIGAFHQPVLVLADVDTLHSLPDRQLRAGYAEVVKYGLLGDAEFYAWLDANRDRVMSRDRNAVMKAIRRSVEMKAEIVARDERETGDRALLNLGHTFGHALEAWAGYSDRLLHGEAVAIGMSLAFRFSERNSLVPPQTAARVSAHLKSVGLPTRIEDIPGPQAPTVDELVTLMGQDKKVVGGEITLILARSIGEAFATRSFDRAAVAAFLEDELATSRL